MTKLKKPRWIQKPEWGFGYGIPPEERPTHKGGKPTRRKSDPLNSDLIEIETDPEKVNGAHR